MATETAAAGALYGLGETVAHDQYSIGYCGSPVITAKAELDSFLSVLEGRLARLRSTGA
jgi:hypothetical protein